VKIGFLQLRPQFGKVRENVKMAVSLLKNVSDATIVLPELFNTGYLFRNEDELRSLAEPLSKSYTVNELKKVAVKRRLNLVFGMAELKQRKVYNSAVLVTAKGKVTAYRKVHLFDREKFLFQPGERTFPVVNVDGVKLGLMICFDWIFPEVARLLALQGAHVICHPSNLVLPYGQQAMRVRAIENRVFVVTANRIGTEKRGHVSLTFTGGSQIVDPKGNVLASAGERNESLKIVEIDPAQAEDKMITPNNHIFEDRRVSLYRSLVKRSV
jgi:predicted amidohydrolase